MNKIQIKSGFSGDVLFEHECENNSIKLTLEVAVKSGADLRGAKLGEFDLSDFDLSDVDLSGADLSGCDLRGACLFRANLFGVTLFRADLRDACLYQAKLHNAYLAGACLFGADLNNADLNNACLIGACMRSRDLRCAIVSDGFVCDGDFHHITNVGSAASSVEGTLELYSCGQAGWYVKRGCFGGSKQEFLDAVAKTHGDNEHGRKYRAIIELFCGE